MHSQNWPLTLKDPEKQPIEGLGWKGGKKMDSVYSYKFNENGIWYNKKGNTILSYIEHKMKYWIIYPG